jgi:uncharacterized Tic20 family protein
MCGAVGRIAVITTAGRSQQQTVRRGIIMADPAESTDEYQRSASSASQADEALEHTALREVASEDRSLAMFAHLGGLAASFAVPLVLWLVKKNSSRFVARQAREALNFQLTVLIGYLLCAVLIYICIGYLLLAALVVYEVIVVVRATIAASQGESYRYPYTIRFLS